jgi:hypothetical protein
MVSETEHNPKDIDGHENSVLSLLSGAPRICKFIRKLQDEHPEYLQHDEFWFKTNHRDLITLVTQRVRVSFWLEFESAIANNRKMKVGQIFGGVCGQNTFDNLMENPIRLAFILCAPADYVVMLREGHNAGLEKIREIFSARILDEEGYLNPKAADIVIKAFAILDARLKGAIVQRVDQRVLQANATLTPQQAQQAMGLPPTNMDDLDKQLAAVRAQVAEYTKTPRHPTPEQITQDIESIEIDMTDIGNGNSDKAKILR